MTEWMEDWQPRTWADVAAGDTVRLAGVTAEVHGATRLTWHVDPSSDIYRPTAWVREVVHVKLSGRPLLDMPPSGPVEVLRWRTADDSVSID